MTKAFVQKKKVLVVEPDLEASARWMAVCREIGLEGRVERMLDRAASVALQWRPDLIALDLNVPWGEGERLLRALQSHPATRFIPIVHQTAQEFLESLKTLDKAATPLPPSQKPLPSAPALAESPGR